MHAVEVSHPQRKKLQEMQQVIATYRQTSGQQHQMNWTASPNDLVNAATRTGQCRQATGQRPQELTNLAALIEGWQGIVPRTAIFRASH